MSDLTPRTAGASHSSPARRGRHLDGAAGAGRGDPRLAAFHILQDVAAGEFAGRSAERRLRGFSPRDRGLAMELAYGCTRLRARLDTELARLLDRPLARVEGAVLQWLRLGLYQVREMRVPAHAAVDESVRGVRRSGAGRAAGLVNGVLRAAVRRGRRPEDFPAIDADPVGYLCTFGSHPEWLVRRWLGRWPLADVRRLVENDNRSPPVHFRVLDATRDVASALVNSGLAVRPEPEWPGSWRLVRGRPRALAERLPVVFQDPAAAAVVEYAAAGAEAPVLDACAAPGGKAVALAHALRTRPGTRTAGTGNHGAPSDGAPNAGASKGGPFIAADVNVRRLRLVAEANVRTGAGLRLVAMDARRPAVSNVRTVLLDAPCTGTGVLRRRPDARWRLGPERLAALTRLQDELLEACGRLIPAGGLLVYATCSLEPEENEDRVEVFLARHPRFRREWPPASAVPGEAVHGNGELRVLPWVRATDGAFACRLRAE